MQEILSSLLGEMFEHRVYILKHNGKDLIGPTDF